MCSLADGREDKVDVGDEVEFYLSHTYFIRGVVIKKPSWLNRYWVVEGNPGSFTHVFRPLTVMIVKKAERIQTGE